MSAHATVWAWNQQAGKAKAVLVALANFADAEGVCRVPQTHLAAMTEQSIRTVKTQLQTLESDGLIVRYKHQKNGVQMLDEIHLCGLRPSTRNTGNTAVQRSAEIAPGPEMRGAEIAPIIKDSFIPYLDLSTTNNNSEREASSVFPETAETLGEDLETPARQTPDGVPAHAVISASLSQNGLKNAHQDGGNVNVKAPESVPLAPPSAYRAALTEIDHAALLPVWRDWIRLNRMAAVTQEAQAPVWAGWITGGHGAALAQNVQDIIQGGSSFTHPWGALRARMGKLTAPPPTPAAAQRIPFKPGYTVRYPDGSTALVVSVQARGITTNHPDFPDMPLAQLKTLEIVK